MFSPAYRAVNPVTFLRHFHIRILPKPIDEALGTKSIAAFLTAPQFSMNIIRVIPFRLKAAGVADVGIILQDVHMCNHT